MERYQPLEHNSSHMLGFTSPGSPFWLYSDVGIWLRSFGFGVSDSTMLLGIGRRGIIYFLAFEMFRGLLRRLKI